MGEGFRFAPVSLDNSEINPYAPQLDTDDKISLSVGVMDQGKLTPCLTASSEINPIPISLPPSPIPIDGME